MNRTNRIARPLCRDNINVLTYNCHEAYQTSQARIDYNFYAAKYEGHKIWREEFRPKPYNYFEIEYIPANLDFDVAISHQKFGGYQFLAPLAQQFQIPLISIEHTASMPFWSKARKEYLASIRGDLNVFISSWSIRHWGFSPNDPTVRVIHHGIETDTFTPGEIEFNERSDKPLVVCNDFINRDFCINSSDFFKITEGLNPKIVGHTEGLSEPAKDTEELVSFYQGHKFYINTARLSPIPTAVLEAMSCGCCVISVNDCAVPEFITSGYNGMLCDNNQEMRAMLEYLMKNPSKAEELGNNARQTMVEKYNIDIFAQNWKDVIGELV